MSINSGELEHQERDLQLRTRGPRAPGKPNGDGKAPAPDAVQELQHLKERIAAARALKPKANDLHCEDCWCRGRDAAIRFIEREPPT